MSDLNPVFPIVGGLLIGLSAALYLLGNGRIAGISGLLATATTLTRTGPRSLSIAFIGGLLGGAWLAAHAIRMPQVEIAATAPLLIVGGILVGVGTRLGGGCTSGHGVCGMARLSKRSIVATLTFMGVAVVTVFVLRHVVAG